MNNFTLYLYNLNMLVHVRIIIVNKKCKHV